jgi:hypothetical protein
MAATEAARCFAALDTWSSLLQLCELFPRAPAACARQLEHWLRRHRNGFRERPSADLRVRVGEALRWAHATAPPRVLREIEFVLRTVG